MNIISFPGFNLNFEISKIAIQIGNIKIYWYAILMVLSFLIALIIYKKEDGKYGIKFQDVLTLSIYVIPISIISARIYYVLFNLSYYIKNPIQIFNIHSGGIAIYGGIIGRIYYLFNILQKK